mgnify:CR=1 FL=1
MLLKPAAVCSCSSRSGLYSKSSHSQHQCKLTWMCRPFCCSIASCSAASKTSWSGMTKLSVGFPKSAATRSTPAYLRYAASLRGSF